MRRLLVPILLAALLAPAAARATPGFPGDGTFSAADGTVSVRNANGKVAFVARGSFIGYCDSCSIWVNDPNPADGAGPLRVRLLRPLASRRSFDASTRKPPGGPIRRGSGGRS